MAAKGLFINSTEQGFTVRGINNNFFPDNVTLAYPANSVILITDESDMATFRSASNYDVLFSALIKDININGERATKDNIIETFNEAANKPMSNPDAFTGVKYDGKSELNFYNDKGDKVANVDVTPFIKDGMIEDVEISEGNLVIHFNTDSDIKDIYIPLTEIFDPETYYTKQEIDNQVNDIWDTIDEKEEVISTSLNALNEDVENLSNDKADASAIATKANASDVYTKTEADNKFLTEHQSLDNYYTKAESDAKYATQVVVNEEIAARIEAIRGVNTALEGKADKSDTYTKAQIDGFLDNATQLLETKADKSNTYTKTETDNAIATAMEDIDLSDYVDVTTFNKKELATAKALTQLNDTKADKTELPDVSTLATKTELNAKANTADLATVATSGSYNDLSDKPVIPDTTNLATKSEVEALEPYAVDIDAYVANGITEAQYDEIVQAVSDGRVIKATYGTRDYTVKSVYVDGDVMKISLSDELKHRFFQFGRSTGTVSPTTAEYVSLVEKGVWNTKANASDVYTKTEIDAMIGNINTILASI